MNMEKPENNLTCGHCGHSVSDVTEWNMGLSPDKPNSADTNSSGLYFCPECECETGHSAFDDFVSFKSEGFFKGLSVTIPTEAMNEIVDCLDELPKGYHFNIGHAILNAARRDLLKTFNDDVAIKSMFGDNNEFVDKYLETIRRKA